MLDLRPVASCEPDTAGGIPEWVYSSDVPVLIRGGVKHWPAIQPASRAEMQRYLSDFWTPRPVTAYVGGADIDGRFFYNEDFSGFNFRSGTAPLADIFDRLAEQDDASDPMAIYVGSTPVDQWLPGFRAQNDIKIPADAPLISFWLGNRTRVSAHFDYPDNVACVVAGTRRFTLFPPEQIKNLYVGPIDKTPSGQSISLVDFKYPDLEKYPRFAEAMASGLSCVCEPGDALFIPSMWWHHVESLSDFNMLVNYWWTPPVAGQASPSVALRHAMLAIRELPERQRAGWKALFEHYVFEADEQVYAHIPEPARGSLAPLDDTAARRLRAEIINRLNQ